MHCSTPWRSLKQNVGKSWLEGKEIIQSSDTKELPEEDILLWVASNKSLSIKPLHPIKRLQHCYQSDLNDIFINVPKLSNLQHQIITLITQHCDVNTSILRGSGKLYVANIEIVLMNCRFSEKLFIRLGGGWNFYKFTSVGLSYKDEILFSKLFYVFRVIYVKSNRISC